MDDKTIERTLRTIPNVGPAVAKDLIRLGIREPSDLAGRDGDELYHELCRIDGIRHDPCMRDVLASAVSYANGDPPRTWWSFTPERKERDRRKALG